MVGQPGRSGLRKGCPKQPQTGRQKWTAEIEEARKLAAQAHKKLREEFNANDILKKLIAKLDLLEEMVINGELPKRDLVDIFDSRVRTMAMLLPYLAPKMASTVITHAIVSESNVDQAREAVLTTMQRLRNANNSSNTTQDTASNEEIQ
jgi:leucyl-tRNA synthetase